jgi:hypothetical protein
MTCQGVTNPVVLEILACQDAPSLSTNLSRDKLIVASDWMI